MTNETETRTYPLANDANGNPIDVPGEAKAWRVRRLAKKAGRPKVIFDPESGRPLELPLTSTIDDLAAHVGESGRYRLEAVDASGRYIPGCVGVTEFVIDGEDEEAPAPTASDVTPQLVQLIAQLVENNTKVMQAMASAFGQVQPAPQIEPVVVPQQAPAQQAFDMSQIMSMVGGALQYMKNAGPKAAPVAGEGEAS